MDFSLNDHQKLIRDTVRQFMEAEVRPVVKEMEKAEKFPAEAIKKLGEMGCCGMLMPEEWGGPGLDTVSYVLMLEEVARVFTAMSTAHQRNEFGGAGAAADVWHRRAEEKIFAAHGDGRNARRILFDGASAGSDAAGIQAAAVRYPTDSCHPERSDGLLFTFA